MTASESERRRETSKQTVEVAAELLREFRHWALDHQGESLRSVAEDAMRVLVGEDGRLFAIKRAEAPGHKMPKYSQLFADLQALLDSIPDDRGREMAMNHVRASLRSFAEIYAEYQEKQRQPGSNIPKKAAK